MNIISEMDLSDLMSRCRENQVPCITSYTRELFIKLLEEYQPTNYLEIGSARGVSLLTAHHYIAPKGGMVTGIERSLPNIELIQEVIDHNQLTHISINHINANHPGREKDVISQPIDFAFIDARKSKYHIYLQTILPYMAPNAIIMCDDVIEFEHKLAPLYEFLDKNQMNYEVVRLGDGDGVIIIRL